MTSARDIDLGLEVLCSLPRTGPLTCDEIADACNCRAGIIRRIEQRALAKLRHPDIKAKLKGCIDHDN